MKAAIFTAKLQHSARKEAEILLFDQQTQWKSLKQFKR